jgi:Domain of unknown function (DUF3425)
VEASASESQLVTSRSAAVDLSFSSPNLLQGQAHADPAADSHFIVLQSFGTWAAFVRIGEMLNLVCMHEAVDGFNIRALTSTLPPTIAPTLKQQVIPHKPYVDVLPWSSLRDQILNSLKVINEAELVMDLCLLRVLGFNTMGSNGLGGPIGSCQQVVVLNG